MMIRAIRNHFTGPAATAAWVVFTISMAALVAYQLRLLNFSEFADETETIVAAKMMVAGSSLYREIFNHHGPLTFLPGMLVELAGGHSIAAHRALIAILQLVSLAALLFSPLIRNQHAIVRVTYTLLIATIYAGILPAGLGHTYSYQVLCGIMLSVAFSTWLLPQIAGELRVGTARTIVGGALVASIPFLAITYIPAAMAFLVASVHKDNWRKVLCGSVAAIAFNLVFLVWTGSVRGYLAFHVYLNAVLLPQYNQGHGLLMLIGNAFHAATSDLGGLLLLGVIVTALAAVACKRPALPWREILVALGLGSMLIRGLDIHGLSYIYVALTMPLLLLHLIPAGFPRQHSLLLVLCCILTARLIVGGAKEDQLLVDRRIPETTEFAQLAQKLTDPGDRILAYSFQNYQYLAAGRLPASGYYFYLPWQRQYLDHPVLGVRIDPCMDIEKARPKLVMLDEWKVWEKYDWASYGGCVIDAMARDYIRLPHTQYYVRKDVAAGIGVLAQADDNLSVSPPVSKGDRFAIAHTPDNTHETPRRIGLRLATYARSNPGVAVLTTPLADGTPSVLATLDLPGIEDNAYAYMEVPPGTTGPLSFEIREGGGISFWESRKPDGTTQPCIIIEYPSTPPGRTPGCPLDLKRLLTDVTP
ncbi:TPA: hypothetical protein ACGY79_001685 [Stenotrophomonas maltophilia]